MNTLVQPRGFHERGTGESVMRSFIRHPSDIPIECQVDHARVQRTRTLKDVSYGGLAFAAREPMDIGVRIRVRIPGIEPPFEISGQVAWCRRQREEFIIGVQFLDESDSYRARMVEQVCHIEHYKAEVQEKEGRQLSGEEAAVEWIMKFAKDFPPP